MFVSWLKLDSTAKKTYPRVTTDKQIENENCGNYYTHKIFSKTLHFEQKQLGLNTFSSHFQTSLRLEGMSDKVKSYKTPVNLETWMLTLAFNILNCVYL